MKTKKEWQEFAKNREYVPERDMFRKIKYGTYNLLELFEMTDVELTEEEDKLWDEWWESYHLREYDIETYDTMITEQIDIELEQYWNIK